MLTKSEKMVKNIMAYLAPMLLKSITPLITFPILTRFLTPSDFGVIALVTNFTPLIVGLLSCNVDVATRRYYFEYRNNFSDLCALINTTVVFLLLVFIFSLPVMYLLKNFLSAKIIGNPSCGLAIFISYVTACLSVLVAYYLTIYRNMEEARKHSLYTMAQLVINVFFGLVFVVGFRLGYMGLIYATFIDSFVIFCILFWKFHKMFPMRLSKKMIWDNLKYGIPLLPENFSGGINDFFDKFMLRSAISISSAGLFSVAQNVSTKLFVFMTAVQSAFYPIYMKDIFDKGKEAASAIGRNFTIFTYISASFILLMILFGEEVMQILAPPSYYGSINVMLIILCGIAMQVFAKIYGVPLTYVKKAYLSFPITVVGTALNVGLNLLFIPCWGAMGAGLALLISVSVTNMIGVWVAQRYYTIFYDKKALFLILANLFLSAAILLYMRSINLSPFIKYSVKLSSLLCFFWIGIRAGIITKRNLKIVVGLLKPKELNRRLA